MMHKESLKMRAFAPSVRTLLFTVLTAALIGVAGLVLSMTCAFGSFSSVAYADEATDLVAGALADATGSAGSDAEASGAAASDPAVSDSTSPDAAQPVSASASGPFVMDNYGLLSSGEYQDLESRCRSMADSYGVGVYLLLVSDIGSQTARDFAIDYYIANNLGVGADRSGILFLIAVDSRDYVTVTYGQGVTCFSEYQIGEMEDAIVSYLSDDQFVAGCQEYVGQCEAVLASYNPQTASSGSGSVSSPASSSGSTQVLSSHVDEDTTQTILICLGIALVIAVGVCFALRAQLKSVAVARNATAYELRDQFRVTASNDVFTGRYVTKTPKPKNDDDSIGGSGFDVGGFGGSSGGKF